MERAKHISVLVLCLIAALVAKASYFTNNGINYMTNEDDTTTVRVTKNITYTLNSDHSHNYYNYRNFIGKDVIIPSEAWNNGMWYKVTKIDDKAFFGAGIKSVVMANSIVEIGDSAFSHEPYWDQDYPWLHDIEISYQNTVETITLPASLRRIGKDAFLNTMVKKLFVPSIGWWCKLDCRSSFPEGYDLYAGGEYVEDLVIPEGVESIHDCCFKGCTNILKTVDLPNSLKHIGISAFDGLGVEKVIIHSLESWCGVDFSSTIASNYDLYLNDELVENAVIPEGVEAIKDYCFSSCKRIKSVNLPISLKTIGTSAFTSYGIGKVVVHSLKSWCELDYNASISSSYDLYLGDELVVDLAIPEGVESIHDNCFAGCKTIKSIDVPNSLNAVGLSAFTGHDINKVVIHSLDAWLNIDFKSAMPSPYEFYLEDETIKNLVVPNSIESINPYAFSYNSSLNEAHLGNSIKMIGLKAFHGCSNMKIVEIPNSVEEIGDNAFYGMSSLRKVVSHLDSPETVEIGKNVFYNSESVINSTLFVPKGIIDRYKNCDQWNQFSIIREIADSDINGDGIADVRDVTELVNRILAGDTNSFYDVNHDGVVDVKDVTLAIGEVLGVF